MYDSFTHQLAGLDLTGLTIKPAPFDPSDFPSEEAVDQTLAAVWSDMFVMFSRDIARSGRGRRGLGLRQSVSPCCQPQVYPARPGER